MKKITIVIPAGGPGGGMYPLSAGMPKSLIPIGDKPMITHILENLDPEVFEKVIIVADKYFPMVQSYVQAFTRDFPIKIIYKNLYVPPTQQLISLKTELSDPFVIHYNDVMTGPLNWKKGYTKYTNFKKKDKALSGLLYVTKDYPLSIGIVEADSKNKEHIGRFLEKPERMMQNMVNMAVAFFDKQFLESIKKDHMSLFGESVPYALSQNKHFTYLEHDRLLHFQRMGEWVDYQTSFYKELPKRRRT